MSDALRAPDESSWIAQERLRPARVQAWWIACISALCAAVFVALIVLGAAPDEATASEVAFRDGGSWYAGYADNIAVGRLWSAAAGAFLVFAVAWSARRLLHGEWSALLAGSLVALDPLLLVYGRLALPVAPATALAVGALASFLSPRQAFHWVGAALLTAGALVQPNLLWWSLPLVGVVLLRGHVYAAPRHVGIAVLQGAVLPALAVLVTAGLGYQATCAPGRLDTLSMSSVLHLGHGLHALPNLTTWFAGMGALLFLGTLAVWTVASDVRMQRLPGRLQFRLTKPLRREHGRILWLVLLAATAPTPWLFLPVFALALAAAVREFSRDASTFAVVVGVALLGLAIAGLARFAFVLQGGVTGEEVTQLLEFVPWANVVDCS